MNDISAMISASIQDKARVVEILSTSFDQNKSVNQLVKQDGRRLQRIRMLMEYAFDECMEFGQVIISKNRDCCALVLFDERKRFSFRSLFRDLKLTFFISGLGNIGRVVAKEKMVKLAHQELTQGKPAYHLWFIGVDPSVQGQGEGSHLLTSLLAESKALGRLLLLETSTEKNLPFYAKFGLKIYKEIDAGYPIYLLSY
ncbi:GNAT family N-acetyltransferase [Pedobacter sp. KR3-3]|uniref:GNAT family N-acetyltransferase n=1 Tax=Pedobacter albus TaxID=3113905 RepID=A0ABU7I2R7_9SPHI|nr:GNAT family N-acetyltransferase [Pedobacter sp. KR3-3]MEE1943738.1 GNAT family N-acetyltransferase [Pedobacter sp. KR3-3]